MLKACLKWEGLHNWFLSYKTARVMQTSCSLLDIHARLAADSEGDFEKKQLPTFSKHVIDAVISSPFSLACQEVQSGPYLLRGLRSSESSL